MLIKWIKVRANPIEIGANFLGLSLYYFISNLISIGIMLVIKNYIIDEDKVLAKIQVSKAKPKKQNRFQKKMADIMAQAETQKALQEKRKK